MGDLFTTNFSSDNCLIILPAPVVVTTFAGISGTTGSSDGGFGIGAFGDVYSISVSNFSDSYIDIADYGNSTYRQLNETNGVVSTIAGLALSTGTADGAGSIARFNNPIGVTTDLISSVFLSDYTNNTIRKIQGNVVSTFAGLGGTAGTADGTGSVARFNAQRDLVVVGSDLFLCDGGNYTIRKLTLDGNVTTFAGTAGSTGTADGSGSVARFSIARGMCADPSGNLYISDTDNNTIRMITPAGNVSTIAGTAGLSGSLDGIGSAARFNFPRGMWHDGNNSIYLADSNNHAIRKIDTTTYNVTTYAGVLGVPGNADGPPNSSLFNTPSSVTGRNGGAILYVADRLNYVIRKIA